MVRKVVVLVVLVVLCIAMRPAQAEDIPTFDSWLKAASGPLAGAIVAVIVSLAVEYWPWYGELSPKQKRLFYIGLCFVLPVLAATLRGIAGYVAWSFDPLYWHALVYGFAAAGLGTLVHTPKLRDK